MNSTTRISLLGSEEISGSYNCRVKIKLKNAIIILILLINVNISFAQNKENLTINQLEKNGINSRLINSNIPEEEINKLLFFDFTPYRNYESNQVIQILNGPTLELYSIKNRIEMGEAVDEKIIDSKKNVDSSTLTHTTMPIINVGYGIKSIEVSKFRK